MPWGAACAKARALITPAPRAASTCRRLRLAIDIREGDVLIVLSGFSYQPGLKRTRPPGLAQRAQPTRRAVHWNPVGCPLWVTCRTTQHEHNESALPPSADMTRTCAD